MINRFKEDPKELLSSSLDAFEDRLKRKISYNQELEETKRREASARHGLMLKAINSIRAVFTKTCRIDLGVDYCGIDLDVSDKEGWPMLVLFLADSQTPHNQDLALLAWASDRRELGTVTIALRSGETLATLHLHDPSEMNRLNHVVQRSIRVFLDCVAERIVRGPEVFHEQPINLEWGRSRKHPENAAPIAAEDIFSSDVKPDDNVVENIRTISRLNIPLS